MKAVGRVQEINLYPVKSMRGVSVLEATLYWYGLNGDRKYAFVRSDTLSGFPWLTARELPELLQYEPRFLTPDEPMTSDVCVYTPSEQALPLTSAQLGQSLSSRCGENISLLHLNRGTYDCMPVSLVTNATFASIQRSLNEPLDHRRFRSNLVIQTDDIGGEPEKTWLGASLTFGERPNSAQISVTYRTKRCVMVDLEPISRENSPKVLRHIAETMQACAGVYGVVSRLGTVELGDTVYVEHHA